MTEPTCASCGATNRPAAKFCSECGVALAARCPACGAEVSGGRFCSECGAALTVTAPAAAEPPAAPVAERRLVSLLFADLVGFTTMSESWDAERVRELQSAYFARARAVVERYGGTIEKFIGDAVCAVWGVPSAREDDAERAVRAGLDLLSAVSALGEEMTVPDLAMRVGITTGQVAVTLGAVGEGMVTGDAVNTAARVQSVASPGQVWVDDATRSLTTMSVAYQPVGRHELKGKAQSAALFHAVRTTAVVGGEQRVDGLEAPFVGRDREFRMVKELFHDTVEEGRARLALVAGEPGIGKSRLAWEFEKYLDGIRSQTSYWLRGRCLSYGTGVAGRVVAEMVRSLLRVTDTDSDEHIQAVLEERLARHVADVSERDVLRPRLASLLGFTDQVFDRADLFACWRAFFEALAADGSAVTLVVEDLQWADDGFLDFLDHLLDATDSPIFVLALARPEITNRRTGIGAGRRATTVYLEPLHPEAMGRLLDGLVADLPASLRTELVRRAEGVPLYAVETVRSLIDRDVVVPVEGRYVVDADAASTLDLTVLAPPASLQALLSARLDALTADERRVVQDSSVLGLTFTVDALRAVVPDSVDVDGAVESLQRKEILTVDSDPRSPERGQLRFVQALLRGVAYETLSRRDRKARHIAVADYLAQTSDPDAIASVLAAHYLDAVAAVEDAPDADALTRQAIEMLERAATHAVSVGAPVDALGHYDRILHLDLPDEDVLRVTKAASGLSSLVAVGDRGMQWISRGLALASSLGLEEEVLAFKARRAQLLARRAEDLSDALVIAREVFDACVGLPERVGLLAEAAKTIAICAQNLGRPDVAREIAMVAVNDIERYGDDSDFKTVLNVLSMWSGLSGYRRLTRTLREAEVRVIDDREPRKLIALSNAAAAAMYDEPYRARDFVLQALEIARTMGIEEVAATAHLLIAHLIVGDWDDAQAVLDRRRLADVSEFIDWEIYVVAGSAVFGWLRGDASQLLPEVPYQSKEVVDPVVVGWILMRRAVAEWFEGDEDAAVQHAVQAVEGMVDLESANEDVPGAYSLALDMVVQSGRWDLLDSVTGALQELSRGQRYRLLHAQLCRAAAHRAGGDVSAFTEAADTFDSIGAAYWLAATRVELAASLAAAGDVARSRELIDLAEPPLRRMGAIPLLGRIESMRAAAVVGT